MKVLAINGSPRKKGNTQAIINAAAEELTAAGIEVKSISLADFDIRPCDGCEKCYKKPWGCPIKDDAVAVLRKMAAADGLLVGSPVYWGGVTAQLKALFDRSIMPYQTADFRDKVGGALTVGGGMHGGQELALSQINTYFLMNDMIVANAEGGFYGGMATGEHRGDAIKDNDGLNTARKVGKRMAHLLRRNES